MATILTKKSDSSSAVPTAGDLTHSSGGAELAVNTADKRLFVKNSGGTVVELGTSPSTIDINAGTIDGTAIGASSASTGAFTTLAASSTATFAAGAVGTPSITTAGDTNTGIYFPAADTIGFVEGGAEAMRIDNSGNVGIGTTSPTTGAKLHVSGGDIRITDTFPSLILDGTTGGNIWSFIQVSSGALETRVNDAAKMAIDSSGNVGIGTSSPAGQLHIVGNDTTDQVIIENTDAAATTAPDLVLYRNSASPAASDYLGRIFFRGKDSAGNVQEYAYINAQIDDATSGSEDGHLEFYTVGAGTEAERMRIDSSGNVGIGTSSPGTLLHIENGSADTRLRIISGTAFDAAIQLGDTASASQGAIIYSNNVDALRFQANGSERMRITSAGEVYIAGTTDQGAYNLQCNGTGVWGAGAYVNGSDERLKENIANIESGLDVVSAMRPVTFTYKEDYSKDQNIQTGFIAQELQQAMAGKNYVDGIVQAGPKYLNVAYQSLIPILTKAIQELKSELDSVKAELATLKG